MILTIANGIYVKEFDELHYVKSKTSYSWISFVRTVVTQSHVYKINSITLSPWQHDFMSIYDQMTSEINPKS